MQVSKTGSGTAVPSQPKTTQKPVQVQSPSTPVAKKDRVELSSHYNSNRDQVVAQNQSAAQSSSSQGSTSVLAAMFR